MIRFKELEVLFHTAALGQRGASGNKLDYQDTDEREGNEFLLNLILKIRIGTSLKFACMFVCLHFYF